MTSTTPDPEFGSATSSTPSGGGPNRIHRVAMAISELRCGGAERVIVHLASELQAMGVAVEILCLQNPGELAAQAEAAGVKVVALYSTRRYDVRAVWSLARQLRRFRPDVIHVHDRSSLPYVVMARRLSGRRPLVFTAHGLLTRDEQSRLRDRRAARHLAQLTAVSPTAAEEYARIFRWNDKVELIDNGVPPVPRSDEIRQQLRRSLAIPDNVCVFLAVGNIKPEKGFEDLLAAADSLRNAAGMPNFKVLIAGGVADKKCFAALLAQRTALKLNGIVDFLGFRPDAQSLYSVADVFVLSSRKEGLPMVLLEAMSAGIPVVATEVGAVPQVICRNMDGLLIPAASPERLAAAMRRLATDAELRTSVGKSGSKTIRNRYNVQRMARQYLTVYENALPIDRHAPVEIAGLPAGWPGGRPSVLMLGPLPPLTGGMATVTCNLRDSDLSRWCRLKTLNNGKTTPEGRSLVAGLWAQARLLRRVLSTILWRRVRVVHIHTCALFSFWRDILHMMAVRMFRCRVVWHIHDGTFPKFISEGSRLKRALIRWALRRGAATIVLSDEALALLEPHAPRVRWHVVPNGVPIPESRRDEDGELMLEAESAVIHLLFLGNLTRRKGAYDLIEAVEVASQRAVRANVMLAGGESEPGQQQEIRQRIAESSCADRIVLLGLLNAEEKQRAIEKADCIVLPSYVEGLPMALLEGMAAGLPAIATNVGSIPTMIDDGVEGFLISRGDVKVLADRICRLAEDAQLRREMGQRARQRVERQFSQRAMAERVYKIYCAAIAGKLPASR